MAIEGLVTPPDNSVTTAKIVDDAVTYAKIQNVSATDKLLGRSTAGAGNVEEIACTAAGRAMVAAADAAAQAALLTTLAPLASPTFTGTPAAPTAAGGTNTTQIATTAFVTSAIAAAGATNLDADNLSVVANSNVVGGIPVVYLIAIANGASGNTNITLTYKTEIIDVVVRKTAPNGGAGDGVAVQTGAGDAITNTMDLNVSATIMVRPTWIDGTHNVISAGGTLRIVATDGGGGNNGCFVTVIGVLRS